MRDAQDVLIFFPMPPTTGWRGEGIAQTIENIIRFSTKTKYTLVVGSHVVNDIQAELSDAIRSERLKILSIGAANAKMDSLPEYRFLTSFYKTYLTLRFYLSLQFFIFKMFILSLFGVNKNRITLLPSPFLAIAALPFSKKIGIFFWDPFVLEFQKFDINSRTLVARLLKYATHLATFIITQSQANKNYLTNFFGVDEQKIHVAEHGAPDYGPLLANKVVTINNIHTFWKENKVDFGNNMLSFYFHVLKKSLTSRHLRTSINKAVLHRLTAKESNKETKIIMVSTQYRPYKGFEPLFDVLSLLTKKYEDKFNFKFIFTGNIPKHLYKKHSWANFFVYEFNRVGSLEHATLYKISDLVIHPSIVEGGLASYPMFEAASLNVPALCNMGRHMFELQTKNKKNIDDVCLDLTNKKESINKILNLLTDKTSSLNNINLINSMRISWADSAAKYEDIFEKLETC